MGKYREQELDEVAYSVRAVWCWASGSASLSLSRLVCQGRRQSQTRSSPGPVSAAESTLPGLCFITLESRRPFPSLSRWGFKMPGGG